MNYYLQSEFYVPYIVHDLLASSLIQASVSSSKAIDLKKCKWAFLLRMGVITAKISQCHHAIAYSSYAIMQFSLEVNSAILRFTYANHQRFRVYERKLCLLQPL